MEDFYPFNRFNKLYNESTHSDCVISPIISIIGVIKMRVQSIA